MTKMKKEYNTWRKNREKYGSEFGVLRIDEIEKEELIQVLDKEIRRAITALKDKGKKLRLTNVGFDKEVHDGKSANLYISFDFENVEK